MSGRGVGYTIDLSKDGLLCPEASGCPLGNVGKRHLQRRSLNNSMHNQSWTDLVTGKHTINRFAKLGKYRYREEGRYMTNKPCNVCWREEI